MKSNEKKVEHLMAQLYLTLANSIYHEPYAIIEENDTVLSNPNVENLSSWLFAHHHPFQNIQMLPSDNLSRILLHSATDDCCFTNAFDKLELFLISIFDELQNYNNRFRGDPLFIESLDDKIHWYHQICNHDNLYPLITPQIINKELQVCLIEGMMHFAEFGLFILSHFFPFDSYMLDLTDDGRIMVTELDFYQYHDNPLTDTLFSLKQMGDNGFDMLYDGTFLLKFRMNESLPIQSLSYFVSVDRLDNKRYLF